MSYVGDVDGLQISAFGRFRGIFSAFTQGNPMSRFSARRCTDDPLESYDGGTELGSAKLEVS